MGISRCPARGAANDAMPAPSNVLVTNRNVPEGTLMCQPPTTAGKRQAGDWCTRCGRRHRYGV